MSRRQPAGQRRYSEAERQEGLALAERVGFAEAGRRLEIPDGTLRRWAHEVSAALEVVEGGELSPVVASLPWPERRAVLLPRLGEVAAKALDAAERAIDAGRGRDAQALMVAAGIAIDKGQLLGGGATSRSESTSLRFDAPGGAGRQELLEEVAALRRELYGDVVDAEVVDDDGA